MEDSIETLRIYSYHVGGDYDIRCYHVELESIDNVIDENEIKRYRAIAKAYSNNKELKGGK